MRLLRGHDNIFSLSLLDLLWCVSMVSETIFLCGTISYKVPAKTQMNPNLCLSGDTNNAKQVYEIHEIRVIRFSWNCSTWAKNPRRVLPSGWSCCSLTEESCVQSWTFWRNKQFPIEKSHWLFVKRTRAVLPYGFACKNMSSLWYSISDVITVGWSKAQHLGDTDAFTFSTSG